MAAGARSMKFPQITTHYFLAVLVCIAAMVAVGMAQRPPTPTPAPPPTAGQMPAKPAKIKDKEKTLPKIAGLPTYIGGGEGITSERSIMVDPKVNLSLCVTEGSVSVNGWSRNEVRVFVKSGSKFDFKVLQKTRDGNPILISLVGIRKLSGGATINPECIAGDEIELDVPENTALSLKGRETETTVDTIRKVAINTVGGDISIRNVAQGVRASTYQGDVTVENSQGGMVLESSSGNIIAFAVAPVDAGDAFKAKTNSGAISIQKMEFRLAEVNSISGSVVFTGELLSGGSFNFSTTNGAIRLALPQTISCRVSITYGFGNFRSELPIQIETENVTPGAVKTIVGKIGSADCTLRLTSSNGAIAIKKQL